MATVPFRTGSDRVKLNIFHKLILLIFAIDILTLALWDMIPEELLALIALLFFYPVGALVLFVAGCIHARYTNSRTINPITMALIAIFYGILMLSRYSYLFPFLLITALLIILTRRWWEVKPMKQERLQGSAENPHGCDSQGDMEI